ncbi:uncharacterized protein LOC114528271 isoform X2 [Dendronephthya gigantea]|uniref:uncharacterized protein LOC114528271 isoform X2 n=1 Tax=Dendronephthya gigantea TaxID=151771 RepID=UPI00106A7972|nr:uncharacterized protein LOC114528271 isoform X2 [Dendronephthya gigantea]
MADENMPSVTKLGNHFASTNMAGYRQKYKTLKRKLKFLLYEQESFQEELRRSQRKLLRVSKDKSFLLDQLLQVEGLDFPSSEDEETAISSSEDELQKKIVADRVPKEKRSKKQAQGVSSSPVDSSIHHSTTSSQDTVDHNNQIRCKFFENGKQCVKYISKRAKSGYCTAHRTVIRISKQNNTGKPTHLLPRSNEQNETELVRQARINDLHLLRNQETNEFPTTSAALPQDVFSMDDDDPTSENEGSTESHSYHNNIYEGDGDLIIDLPE